MTYRQLFLFIRKLSNKQLDMDVMVHVNHIDAYLNIERVDVLSNGDENDNHPILVTKE